MLIDYNITMFNISDYVKNMRSKMLAWSAACLFIAKTKVLPEEIALLGINLHGQEDAIIFFISGFTFYYLLQFCLPATLELVKHFIPLFYNTMARKFTGDVYGLTLDDIKHDDAKREHHQDEYRRLEYTPQDEASDIYKKYNNKIKHLEEKFTSITTWLTIFIGVFVPVLFCVTSIYCLLGLFWFE